MKIFRLLIFCILTLITEDATSQGLGFKSTDSQIANRTSYTVFSKYAPKFHDELILSFELSILDPNSFGFICIIDADGSNKDYSFSYLKVNNSISHLKLNLKGEENLLTIPVRSSLLGKGKWLKVKLSFNFKENMVKASVNTDETRIVESLLNDPVQYQIFFGKIDNIIDVPSFAIRNLTVSDSRETFNFKFKEYTGNTIHDQNGKAIGIVENPVWLINDSYHWKHRFSYSVNDLVAVNYDSISMKLFVAEKDSIAIFDMGKNSVVKRPYANKLSVPIRLGSSFFYNGELFVYEVNDVSSGYPTMASMDLETYSWKTNSYLKLDHQRHHHNAYLNPDNQQLLIFGGFGNNSLSNSFNSYDILNDSWSTLNFSGDVITPRFFSGVGKFNGKLYLFGGVGNKTGDQSIGKIYYYDCYSIDLNSRKIQKLWELNRGNEKLVSTRNLIISGDTTSFYTLCYPEYIPKTHIKLYKYNLKSGAFLVLGDSIPIISEEILTNANLYLNSNNKELYCVIQEISNGKSTKVSVYSIDNPPISTEELYIKPGKDLHLIYWVFGCALFVAVGFVLFWMLSFRRKHLLKEAGNVGANQKKISKRIVQPKKNAIYIFGLFTVFNRTGQDCTHLFSPQLKQLFLLILLRSNKGDAGITSEEIYNLVWPDKPLRNAKNLKGVTINKLRTILSDIDGIELVLENQHFKFKTDDTLYNDYFDLRSLYLDISEDVDDDKSKRLIEITSRGEFLLSGDSEYFDKNKRELADETLILVPDILKYYYFNNEFAKTIAMATVLYCVDELNECALYYIINSNLRLGDESAAKKHYNNYILKYKKLQGEDYCILYPELVKIAVKYLKNVK